MRLDDQSRTDPALLAMETDKAQKIFWIQHCDITMAFALAGSVANNDSSLDLVSETQRQVSHLAKGHLIAISNSYEKYASIWLK